jgi:hypothetical protein
MHYFTLQDRLRETIQGCSRMRGPVNPVQLRGFGTHTHIHAVCSAGLESLERFGSQHARSSVLWTPKLWWRRSYKRSKPPASRSISAAVAFMLRDTFFRRVICSAAAPESDSVRLKATFNASCCFVSRVRLASSMRKLQNGSSLTAVVLCGVCFDTAAELNRAAAESRLLDACCTSSRPQLYPRGPRCS